MKKLILTLPIFFLLAACAAPDDNHLGSDSVSDNSSKTVSESELNSNGCYFHTGGGAVGLDCEKVRTVELLFAQKMSVIRYEQSIRHWLHFDNMRAHEGSSMNKRTWDVLNKKSTFAYVLIRNRNAPNPLAFQEYASLNVPQIEDPKQKREGLEFLLRLGLEVGSITTFKENRMGFDCKGCYPDWKTQVASSLKEFEADATKNAFNTQVATSIHRVLGQ